MNGREYADHLGVSHSTVKRWLGEGLPAERIGRRLEIDPTAADGWVAARRPSSIAIDRRSMIYIAARASDGAIKIGFTSDIERRLPELRKEARDVVKLLAAFPGTSSDEARLHDRFSQHRLDGEWFRPCVRISRFVDGLAVRAGR